MRFTTEELLAQHKKIEELRSAIDQGKESLQRLVQMHEDAKNRIGNATIEMMAEVRVLNLMKDDSDAEKPA
jgi:hypothetical protein